MLSRIKLQGKWYDRIPYDEEDGDCFDCGCKKGEYHEHGCDVERCPACRCMNGDSGQLISCGCFDNSTIVEECSGEISTFYTFYTFYSSDSKKYIVEIEENLLPVCIKELNDEYIRTHGIGFFSRKFDTKQEAIDHFRSCLESRGQRIKEAEQYLINYEKKHTKEEGKII